MSTLTRNPYPIGCHVSIRNGYLAAAKTAHRFGAGAYQFFSKNPKSLSIKSFNLQDTKACADYCQQSGLFSVIHSPYPTNLAAEEERLQQVVASSLLNDLEIAEACGSIGVVVHFGKAKEKQPLQGYKNIIQCLNRVTSQYHGQALILIENQAGEGSSMGTTLDEMVQIRNLTEYPERIGFCLDTCHAFASGLWNGHNWLEVEELGRKLEYFPHLKVIHLNDSLFPSGSARDRHANIGQGFIGAVSLAQLLNSTSIRGIPVILETSTGADQTHQAEIQYVKNLII